MYYSFHIALCDSEVYFAYFVSVLLFFRQTNRLL